MKWHFRTLGMGSVNYRSAARRLAREASITGLFETAAGLNESDFRLADPDFWGDHKRVLHARVPGFGWWLWKPYFILNSLLSIPEGDGLLYLDAGSVIKSDEESVLKISEYMALASVTSIIGSNTDFFPEEKYTSRDLLDYFNLTDQQRRDSQYCAAIIFIINDSKGRAFLREWCRLVCVDDHKWLIPLEINVKNHPEFKHHMYDQSTFSCLMKTYGGLSVDTGNKDVDGAIRLARHRYGFKSQESRPYIKYFYQSLYLLTRANLAIQHRLFKGSLSLRPKSHELRIS
jgi:hypothetical protein